MINKQKSLFGNHENELTSITEWIIFDDIATLVKFIKVSLYVIIEKLEAQQIYKLSSKIFFHDDNNWSACTCNSRDGKVYHTSFKKSSTKTSRPIKKHYSINCRDDLISCKDLVNTVAILEIISVKNVWAWV